PLIESQGIPCGRINRIDQALNDAQVKHRNMRAKVIHQGLGSIDILASPIRMSETPTRVDRAPPMLGEHTEEVLEELLECSADDISALRELGII
ncbi:MAG: CoA transferase, partial [Gammaproteobacteria bacterium]